MDEAPRGYLSLANQRSNVNVNNSRDQVGQNSSESSESTLAATVNVGNVMFTEMEMQKIMADEKLTEIARSDPKRAKRVLRNRQSALRSKERKLRHVTELEERVESMQSQSANLSSQLIVLQNNNTMLTNHINDLKHRIRAMEQHEQIQDAMQEALDTKVHQLRNATQ